LVAAHTVYGSEEGAVIGDLPIAQYRPMPAASLEAILVDKQAYLQGATDVYIYDVNAWKDRGEPAFSINLARVTHVSDLAVGDKTEIAVQIAFTDGLAATPRRRRSWRQGPRRLRDAAAN